MKNSYVMLRARILWRAFRRGKLTLRKLCNAARCVFSHFFRREKSGALPAIINFELWNQCNARCPFCRTEDGVIKNRNPKGKDGDIPIGQLDFDTYRNVIDQVAGHVLIAVLYVNGEPLLYPRLNEAIRYATDSRVSTLISTNGMLLKSDKAGELLDSGLDFIKVAISGMTQEVYGKQHSRCDIEVIKKNLADLARIIRERNASTIVMIDYIRYKYNEHELEAARDMCDAFGFIFNVRPGVLEGMEQFETEAVKEDRGIEPSLCSWPWSALTVDWNGNLLPCCDYVVWGGSKPYATFKAGETDLRQLWNGLKVRQYRKVHTKAGRGAIDVCSKCDRIGTSFKF